MSGLFNSIFIFSYTFLISKSLAFDEDSIFEDEDIYIQALPPITSTGITAPGTKWCGPGNTASHYDDLGTSVAADICCRAHDHCEEIMEKGTSLHGLHNPDWFPRLKCSCEQQFINCLQSANTMTSNTLGRVYFGTRSVCFGLGYPILQCREYQAGTFRKRCIRYDIDRGRPKQWQFYNMPFYSISANSLSRTSRRY